MPRPVGVTGDGRAGQAPDTRKRHLSIAVAGRRVDSTSSVGAARWNNRRLPRREEGAPVGRTMSHACEPGLPWCGHV